MTHRANLNEIIAIDHIHSARASRVDPDVIHVIFNIDWWFNRQRKQEAVDLWRKSWNWVRG